MINYDPAVSGIIIIKPAGSPERIPLCLRGFNHCVYYYVIMIIIYSWCLKIRDKLTGISRQVNRTRQEMWNFEKYRQNFLLRMYFIYGI